jgi:hypothetical protein
LFFALGICPDQDDFLINITNDSSCLQVPQERQTPSGNSAPFSRVYAVNGRTDMEYNLIGLIILVLDIIAIVHILQSGLSTVKKLLWILVVLILPVVGMILWFLLADKKV